MAKARIRGRPRKLTRELQHPKTMQRQAVARALDGVLTERILKLRINGLSEREIAKHIVEEEKLVPKLTQQRVNKLLMEALDGIAVPEAEKLKKMELQRLDDIIGGHYANACAGDVGATHAVLACIDRRNRLLGIGQEKVTQTQTLGADGKPIDPIRPVINLTITRNEEP